MRPSPKAAAAPPEYPSSLRGDVVDVLHGERVADPYRWLEDASRPEVKDWMAAQDGLARRWLGRLPGRDDIARRAQELLYVESAGVPVKRGERLFFMRRAARQEKAVLWVKDGAAPERVLLDPNGWSRDGSVALGGWEPSWDGRRLAYQVKPNNSDEAILHVVAVDSGEVSQVDEIPGAKYASPSWTPDGGGFYYTWIPSDPRIPVDERPGWQEVRFHRLGEDPSRDAVIRERNGDPTTFVQAQVSRDGRLLVVTLAHGWSATDVWVRDLRAGDAAPLVPVAVGRPHIYDVWPYAGRLFIRTNDGAPLWRVVVVDPARPEPEHWTEIVPEREATLQGLSVVGGHLALSYLERAASRLEIRTIDGRAVRTIPLPSLGIASQPSGEEDEDEAFYSFESFTIPREIHRTSIRDGNGSRWFKLDVPVDPGRYQITQATFPSRDGTPVSMFIVHARGAKRDGTSPALLYGYGGFQVPMTPSFRASIYPWLERGGIWAVANLRGGSEYGEAWHQGGMRERKQNTFDDFIAAAEHLVREGWTAPARLAIQGGSNGGLLVGAALTQRPDLFRVALCEVPLLDMVRYHRFGSGRTWIQEYGSADDPALFAAIRAYSPYHHVEDGKAYPATLLLSADADDRVDPMHARKFAAALQHASRGGPVLLRIEANAGHGGADLLRSEVEKIADRYAFALSQMN
ncbi:MAG TPA: prolyl oligopeptidase family serine peptidase [Anaeromyxobacteraceae bacterium]|nr:prolyl oligopeptidase family serine peptidase [Anaeromyxobacteraceae bacterium]